MINFSSAELTTVLRRYLKNLILPDVLAWLMIILLGLASVGQLGLWIMRLVYFLKEQVVAIEEEYRTISLRGLKFTSVFALKGASVIEMTMETKQDRWDISMPRTKSHRWRELGSNGDILAPW